MTKLNYIFACISIGLCIFTSWFFWEEFKTINPFLNYLIGHGMASVAFTFYKISILK